MGVLIEFPKQPARPQAVKPTLPWLDEDIDSLDFLQFYPQQSFYKKPDLSKERRPLTKFDWTMIVIIGMSAAWVCFSVGMWVGRTFPNF
jgi:hypothetical protein